MYSNNAPDRRGSGTLLRSFAFVAMVSLMGIVRAQIATPALFLTNALSKYCPNPSSGCFYDSVTGQHLSWPKGAVASMIDGSLSINLGETAAIFPWPKALDPSNGFTIAARIRWTSPPVGHTAIWSIGTRSFGEAYGTLNSLGAVGGTDNDTSWTFGKHRWDGQADDPTGANTSYWVPLWEPATPSGPTWVTLFVRFYPNSKATIDAFFTADGRSVRWEESLLDFGFPIKGYPSGSSSPNVFMTPSVLMLGVPPETYPQHVFAQPAVSAIAAYSHALSDDEMVGIVNSALPVLPDFQLEPGLQPCNTGKYLAQGWDSVKTACGVVQGALKVPPDNAWSSYRRSCSELSVNLVSESLPVTATLNAVCSDGTTRKTSHLWDFRRCAGAGDIWQFHGNLTCVLPPGSYRDSCDPTTLQADGQTLAAKCSARDGSWFQTELPGYRKCRLAIYNFDGGLTCGEPPGGSYQKTCHAITATPAGDLAAYCEQRNKTLKRTTLASYRGCKGDIRNVDGNLQCDR